MTDAPIPEYVKPDLVEIRENAEYLAEHMAGLAPGYDLAECALLLLDVKAASAALSNVRRALESEIAARTGTGDHLVEGVGLLEVKPKVDRKGWDHVSVGSKLLSVAPTLANLDRTTGLVESVEQTLLRLFLSHAGISYWKQSLKQVGIKADDYCTRTDEGYSVTVRGGR